MLQAITKRLKRGKRGISTVIVVMLSLVLIVIIVGNVVLWSYQMNQLDLERIHEEVKITNVSRINNSSWFTTQSDYMVNVGGRTSGSYTDTQAVDNQSESFIEGLNWWSVNYQYRRQITITNNAASTINTGYSVCVTMDTATLFSTGKMLASGNDLRIAYWSGSIWIELDREVINANNVSTQVWFKTQAAIGANGADSNYYVYYGNPSAGSPPANKSNVYLWFDDFNRADNPDITAENAYNVKTGGGAWSIETDTLKNVGASGDPNKLIVTALGSVSSAVDMLVKIKVMSFAGGDLSRMGLSCCMDTPSSRGSGYCALLYNDINRVELLNDLRSWGTLGTYSWSLNTWYYMRFRVTNPAGSLGQVKVWQVGANEPSAWTVDGNFGGGTPRSYGEVGFAGSRQTDTTYFDDILIRFAADVEPSTSLGSEEGQNGQGSNKLDLDGTFVIDAFTFPLASIKNVEIQIRYKSSDTVEKWYLKAYNWTSSTYSDNGFNSTIGQTPTGGWDYYAVDLGNYWRSYVHSNGTVYVKVFDEGVDGNRTTIDIDFLAVRAIIDGTVFTFENRGSSTSHLVSLWVNNSTLHQRYDINVFINAGEVASNFLSESLPNKLFVIKVVTERGNIAVFSSG